MGRRRRGGEGKIGRRSERERNDWEKGRAERGINVEFGWATGKWMENMSGQIGNRRDFERSVGTWESWEGIEKLCDQSS